MAELTVYQLIVAFALIVLCGGLSVLLQLGLQKSVLIAGLRAAIQLLLLGFVLEWVFAISHPVLIIGIGVFMVLAATQAHYARVKIKYKGMFFDSVLSLLVVGVSSTVIALAVIFQIDPWYEPQYSVPLIGIILGNSLNGVSLGLDRSLRMAQDQRKVMLMDLYFGASSWEAFRPIFQESMRSAMTPILNSMSIVGIVSFPGVMTGQILAGASPFNAIKYQMAILFLLAFSIFMGSLSVILLAYRRAFNDMHVPVRRTSD